MRKRRKKQRKTVQLLQQLNGNLEELIYLQRLTLRTLFSYVEAQDFDVAYLLNKNLTEIHAESTDRWRRQGLCR